MLRSFQHVKRSARPFDPALSMMKKIQITYFYLNTISVNNGIHFCNCDNVKFSFVEPTQWVALFLAKKNVKRFHKAQVMIMGMDIGISRIIAQNLPI